MPRRRLLVVFAGLLAWPTGCVDAPERSPSAAPSEDEAAGGKSDADAASVVSLALRGVDGAPIVGRAVYVYDRGARTETLLRTDPSGVTSWTATGSCDVAVAGTPPEGSASRTLLVYAGVRPGQTLTVAEPPRPPTEASEAMITVAFDEFAGAARYAIEGPCTFMYDEAYPDTAGEYTLPIGCSPEPTTYPLAVLAYDEAGEPIAYVQDSEVRAGERIDFGGAWVPFEAKEVELLGDVESSELVVLSARQLAPVGLPSHSGESIQGEPVVLRFAAGLSELTAERGREVDGRTWSSQTRWTAPSRELPHQIDLDRDLGAYVERLEGSWTNGGPVVRWSGDPAASSFEGARIAIETSDALVVSVAVHADLLDSGMLVVPNLPPKLVSGDASGRIERVTLELFDHEAGADDWLGSAFDASLEPERPQSGGAPLRTVTTAVSL